MKAFKAMSFADCCIAGLSKSKKAILVHKDPAFEQVEDEIWQLKWSVHYAHNINVLRDYNTDVFCSG